jgi:hypothetical protein
MSHELTIRRFQLFNLLTFQPTSVIRYQLSVIGARISGSLLRPSFTRSRIPVSFQLTSLTTQRLNFSTAQPVETSYRLSVISY